MKDSDPTCVLMLVNSRLEQIADWGGEANAAGYCVFVFARNSGVSVSTVERYTRDHFKTPVKRMMTSLRMSRARGLLTKQLQVKQVAAELGYSHPQHFSRDFKRYHGFAPREFVMRA